ncbi:MAG: glycosyltransferase family 39 protein [Myxococcales bacterium]|nr:glycosyltransferase family 39 protein [Myxococcales bacterium]
MRRPALLAWALALASVHGILLWLYYWPEPKLLMGDERMYADAALALSAGQDAHLTLLYPPLYPNFLAGILRLTGPSLWGIQLVQTALLGWVAFVTRDLCRRLTGRQRVGDLAAAGLLVYPPLVAFGHYLWPEILHLAFFVSALWILAARRSRPVWSALLGGVLGLALLTKSLLGPLVPLLLAPLAFSGRPAARAARVALAAAALAATVLPTMVSNLERAGSFTIANSGWFNLWLGLNDVSRKVLADPVPAAEYNRFQRSAPTFAERNRIVREQIRERVRERGVLPILGRQLERQWFRLFDKDSFLTDQLPVGATPHRVFYRRAPLALAQAIRAVSWLLYGALLVGAVWGVAVMDPGLRRRLWLAFAFLAYNLAIFLLLHVKSRYRVQLMPFLFGFAALGADWCTRWVECRRAGAGPAPARPSAGAAVGAAAGAALLLFLAFGRPLLG